MSIQKRVDLGRFENPLEFFGDFAAISLGCFRNLKVFSYRFVEHFEGEIHAWRVTRQKKK